VGIRRVGNGLRWNWEVVVLSGGEVHEEIGEMEGRIRKVIERIGTERMEDRKRIKGWWDEECREKKREVRRTLREKRKWG